MIRILPIILILVSCGKPAAPKPQPTKPAKQKAVKVPPKGNEKVKISNTDIVYMGRSIVRRFFANGQKIQFENITTKTVKKDVYQTCGHLRAGGYRHFFITQFKYLPETDGFKPLYVEINNKVLLNKKNGGA